MTEPSSPAPDAPGVSPPSHAWRAHALAPFIEASAIGLALGLFDITITAPPPPPSILGYLIAAFILGVRHAGRAWQCLIPLGVSLYIVHVTAIACGLRPPYVEESIPAAAITLSVIYIACVGLMAGAAMSGLGHLLVRLMGHKSAPSPFPRLTVRRILAATAAIALLIAFGRWLIFDAGTVYAPGFNQAKFESIQLGMTPDQVRAILGPPLHDIEWDTVRRNWTYTEQITATSNYHRRWVFFENDQVTEVVNDYWFD